MGFKNHTTLKCHYCKAKKALGGTKKMGNLEDKQWKRIIVAKVGRVWLCPSCSRRKNVNA